MKDLNEQHLAEVLQLIQQNRKIEAIKLLMEITSLGLQEAKDFVDILADQPDLASVDLSQIKSSSKSQTFSSSYQHEFEEEQFQDIMNLIRQNKKVEAVKYVKDHSNLGLQQAKDLVETFQQHADILQSSTNATDLHEQQNSFSKIQINHSTQEVSIITKDGDKFLIDEHHPLWAEAMQFFTGKMYATKQDYINSLHQKNDEWMNASASKASSENHSHQSSAFHHANRPTAQGIEKNKPIFSLITILVIILIIAVGIAILLS